MNETAIRQYLNRLNVQTMIQFHILDSIDSTNRYLKSLTSSNITEVCCAETQTQGRGRFGRVWQSLPGENIYCSIRKPFHGDLKQLSGLSLVVSMIIVAALNAIGIDQAIQIKWPNDLLWNNQKLCGNLIEIVSQNQQEHALIIGIGINVNANTQESAWCSLSDITGKTCDRNRLVAELIAQLEKHLELFLTHGLKPFFSTWNTLDYLINQPIRLNHHKNELTGIARGIDETGRLMLMDERGVMHYLSSGDTSLAIIPDDTFQRI